MDLAAALVLILLAFLIIAVLFLVIEIRKVSVHLSAGEQFNRDFLVGFTRLEEALKRIGDETFENSRRMSEHLVEVKTRLEEVKTAAEAARELKEILWKPKSLGTFGETSLYTVISDVLPKEVFETQYRFKNGNVVDLAIKLDGRIIPVDSKFPTSAFNSYLTEENQAEKAKKAKEVISAVKKHVDDISVKYINPAENTFDFALMYIPSESLYQELVSGRYFIEAGLDSYFRKKSVYPVSPGTFYSYLSGISYVLKNMRLEKSLTEITGALTQLEISLNSIQENARVLQSHLKNASKNVDTLLRLLEDFSRKLDSLSSIIEEDNS